VLSSSSYFISLLGCSQVSESQACEPSASDISRARERWEGAWTRFEGRRLCRGDATLVALAERLLLPPPNSVNHSDILAPSLLNGDLLALVVELRAAGVVVRDRTEESGLIIWRRGWLVDVSLCTGAVMLWWTEEGLPRRGLDIKIKIKNMEAGAHAPY